jgi:hypothetical protein
MRITVATERKGEGWVGYYRRNRSPDRATWHYQLVREEQSGWEDEWLHEVVACVNQFFDELIQPSSNYRVRYDVPGGGVVERAVRQNRLAHRVGLLGVTHPGVVLAASPRQHQHHQDGYDVQLELTWTHRDARWIACHLTHKYDPHHAPTFVRINGPGQYAFNLSAVLDEKDNKEAPIALHALVFGEKPMSGGARLTRVLLQSVSCSLESLVRADAGVTAEGMSMSVRHCDPELVGRLAAFSYQKSVSDPFQRAADELGHELARLCKEADSRKESSDVTYPSGEKQMILHATPLSRTFTYCPAIPMCAYFCAMRARSERVPTDDSFLERLDELACMTYPQYPKKRDIHRLVKCALFLCRLLAFTDEDGDVWTVPVVPGESGDDGLFTSAMDCEELTAEGVAVLRRIQQSKSQNLAWMRALLDGYEIVMLLVTSRCGNLQYGPGRPDTDISHMCAMLVDERYVEGKGGPYREHYLIDGLQPVMPTLRAPRDADQVYLGASILSQMGGTLSALDVLGQRFAVDVIALLRDDYKIDAKSHEVVMHHYVPLVKGERLGCSIEDLWRGSEKISFAALPVRVGVNAFTMLVDQCRAYPSQSAPSEDQHKQKQREEPGWGVFSASGDKLPLTVYEDFHRGREIIHVYRQKSPDTYTLAKGLPPLVFHPLI